MARNKTFSKTRVQLAGLEIDILRKNVKNLNLRVYPAEERVRISVPRLISEKAVIQFIEDKLPWIKKHISNYRKRPHKEPLKYITGEKHLYRGKELELRVVKKNKAPHVFIDAEKYLVLQVRPDSGISKRSTVLKEWYRSELKKEIPLLIEKWEKPMGVSVQEFGVKLMKTRWGTCNIRDQRIWLNLELAKKRPELLEYVVVHEMVHLLERLHNQRFYSFMSQFLPGWKILRNELNDRSAISDC